MPTCPVCQSSQPALWAAAKDYEYFTSGKEYSYYQCPDCSTIFIHPVPLDELKQIYPSNYYSFVSAKKGFVVKVKEWLDRRHFNKILRQIQSPSIKVLDVGGGHGFLSDVIRQADPRVTKTQIVDIDSKAREVAQSKGHDYFEGRLEDFESTDRYDLVLMLNLIEHVADPLAMLSKAASLLSDRGIILIKTPNTRSLDARLFKNSYWGGLHCPRHWVIFSDASLRAIVDRTPLRIKRLEFTQGGPFWAFSMIVWMHRKGWVNVSAERPVIFHPMYPFLGAATAAFDFVRRLFAKTSQVFVQLERRA